MKPKNLLIFPAGTEIAFEILNALKYSKFVKIYGGTSVADHSEFVYKNLITGFPFVTEPNFIDFLNDVIDREKIDCIYPAHDSVCMFLSEHLSKINAQVIISDYETVKICRSKAETYKFFEGESFLPITYSTVEQVNQYPVFVKPTIGQGAIGTKKINNKYELEEAIREDSTLVICEYLSGSEYTIDCFTDRHGKLRVVKFRERQRIRAGISVRSQKIEPNEDVMEIATIINKNLKMRGAWFFQVKRNREGRYILMEISPRIPGTMGLSRNEGINFPMLTLFDFWDFDVNIIDNGYDIIVDRAFYSAYQINIEYEHIYMDYDDTLVIGGKTNADLMRFIYQAVNNGKKIHLLSKHIGNIYEDMQKAMISDRLFEEIIVISPEDEKCNFIKEKNAIFIDDSFAERMVIHNVCKIPVFDVDMVESLIDWKN